MPTAILPCKRHTRIIMVGVHPSARTAFFSCKTTMSCGQWIRQPEKSSGAAHNHLPVVPLAACTGKALSSSMDIYTCLMSRATLQHMAYNRLPPCRIGRITLKQPPYRRHTVHGRGRSCIQYRMERPSSTMHRTCSLVELYWVLYLPFFHYLPSGGRLLYCLTLFDVKGAKEPVVVVFAL